MTTTTQPTSQKSRLQKIADRINEYSLELEDFACDMEEGPRCDALFAAVRNIDEARNLLENLAR